MSLQQRLWINRTLDWNKQLMQNLMPFYKQANSYKNQSKVLMGHGIGTKFEENEIDYVKHGNKPATIKRKKIIIKPIKHKLK